ncbi:barstar family protein [Streptosporangium sp. NPDC023615]|uniref:barstar family protein n=1 Tax=Streptosporangium sp. NPDC023615 TaxID=3154794 RepID=UPI00343C121E
MKDSEPVVDLRGRRIETLDDFWDAVAEPCGLPRWFGRNLDTWSDTIHTRGTSKVIDNRDMLVVHVDRHGLLEGSCRKGQDPTAIFDGNRTGSSSTHRLENFVERGATDSAGANLMSVQAGDPGGPIS